MRRVWMKKLSLTFVFLFFSSLSFGNDKYQYCEFWGIAGGNDDGFMQNLTGRLIIKSGIEYSDSTCNAVKRDAYQFSKKYSSGNLKDGLSMERWMKYQNFRDKVFDKLITSIE